MVLVPARRRGRARTAGGRRQAMAAAMTMALLPIGALTLLGSCSGDIGTVDLVQPGYIAKADLLNKSWYYRRTVVDAPESVGPDTTIGTGDLFLMERLRFDFQEDFLIGYRDYEFTLGAEAPEDGVFRGSPVVAFPISSHFDIEYTYDAATGARTNVREPNTVDREWHAREFAVVDWSVALHGDDQLLAVDWLEGDTTPGSPYFIHQDEATHPDHARLTPASGYFDFVSSHLVKSDPATCYYTFNFSNPFGCGGGDLKVRHAFMAVDEEEAAGYAPLYYPDNVVLTDGAGNEIPDPATGGVLREPIFDRFGYYRLERMTYDNERGLTESGRLYNIIRFNIWQRSVDATGGIIPYTERTPKAIHYWLNWDFPADLYDVADEVAAEWNSAFKETVASLQGTSLQDTPDMFILHRNSCSVEGAQNYVAAHAKVEKRMAAVDLGGKTLDDLAASVTLAGELLDNYCSALEYHSQEEAEPFLWQQNGDSRFNMLYWITNVVPSAFSGYGPMLGDPVSGRNVVSSAYVLGWTVNSAATRAVEYIRYMNDDLSLQELLNGTNVPNAFFNGDFNPKARGSDVLRAQGGARDSVTPERLAELERRFSTMGDSRAEMLPPVENGNYPQERLQRVHGSALERGALLRPEDFVLATRGRWGPGQQLSAEDVAQAQYISATLQERQRQDRMRSLGERTMCPLAVLDDALVGLAERLKGLSPQDLYRELRRELFKAVALHEVGHNLGLRHNFAGSYDAMNYNRTYWDIDEESPTDELAKLRASQPEYKYSSIMDYHGKVNADYRGIGLYDRAAIKFGYGQLIETFTDETVVGGSTLRDWRELNDYRDLLYADADGQGAQGPAYFSEVDQMYNRTDVLFDWNEDGLSATKVAAMTAREVPYLFCSDEYANTTPECKRFDFGANQREIQSAAAVRYRNYFIFSNFLRNRLTLGSPRSRGRAAFVDTALTYHYFYLNRVKDEDFLNTDLGADMAMAVENGLNLMSEVISMPQPGTYYRCVLNEGTASATTTYYSGGSINIDPLVDAAVGVGPDGERCYLDNTETQENNRVSLNITSALPLFFGFSDEYINWTFTYFGTYWDKIAALDAMTWPVAYFPRENLAEQQPLGGAFSLSFYRLYPNEVNNILLGLIEYDRLSLASSLDDGQVEPLEMVGPPRPAAVGRIVPALARNLQVYGMLFGMAYLTSPFDETLDFARRARVVVKGAADDFFDAQTLPDVSECILPEGSVTFRAYRTSPWDDTLNQPSRDDIGLNFVRRCQADVVEWQASRALYDDARTALEQEIAAASVVVGSEEHGARLKLIQDFKTEFDRDDRTMRRTEQSLHNLRDMNRLYEYGTGY